jgi:hypothetical protein
MTSTKADTPFSRRSPRSTPTAEPVPATAKPSELNTYYKNARRGDVSAIAASLKAHDQMKPITVNRGTFTGRVNEVLAGNHTLMAVRDLAERFPDDPRWSQILVHWVDVDEDRAARFVVADNRTAELGGFDAVQMAELLKGFGDDLDGIGYTAEQVADLADLANAVVDDPNGGEPDPLPGNSIIQYNLIFDDETQQAEWFAFLKWLKQTYFDSSTIAERLTEYLQATAAERT